MKNITECLEDRRSIAQLIDLRNVNESFRDVLALIKKKFRGAVAYLKGIVAKFGSYFIPVDKSGNIMPCVSPLTAGQAYKDGKINKASTIVCLDKEGQKITGCKTKYEDAFGLAQYSQNSDSRKYWERCAAMVGESKATTIADLLESDDVDDSLKNFIRENKNEAFENMINEVKLHTDAPQAVYNIITDDDDLKHEIKIAIKGQSARLMIWGAPGIGKSAILRNVLKELRSDFPDYKLIIKTLSNETPDNFTLPTYVYKEDGTAAELETTLNDNGSGNGKYRTTEKGTPIAATDVPKTWMPVYKPTGDELMDEEMDAALGHGLLFIDELSRATPQVLNVVLPLVNEGDFNGYKLGSGWSIVVASNREEDEESGQSNIGNALANRFAQVYYEPTCKTWRKWADKQNFMSPLLLQWLSMPEHENMSGGKFYYWDYNESGPVSPTKLMCTPRSWTNAMRELASYAHTGTLEGFTIFELPENVVKRVLNKNVPKDAVDSFWAFLQTVSRIGDFDMAVREVWTNAGKNLTIAKKDLNLVILPLAQLICSAHADKLPTKKEWESLCDWMISCNSDQLASSVLDVYKNVFCGSVKETLQNGLFIMQKVLKNAGADKSKINLYTDAYAPFCQKWGIKLQDIPDYSEGLQKLSKKYGEAFKAAVVNGMEGLG